MWTKLEGAVSAECNEIVASKKFKERVQKPKETITSFVTDLMLLVKDCNYIDEDGQVRDQFVYGVLMMIWRKNCLKKATLSLEFKLCQLAKPMKLQTKKFRNAV